MTQPIIVLAGTAGDLGTHALPAGRPGHAGVSEGHE